MYKLNFKKSIVTAIEKTYQNGSYQSVDNSEVKTVMTSKFGFPQTKDSEVCIVITSEEISESENNTEENTSITHNTLKSQLESAGLWSVAEFNPVSILEVSDEEVDYKNGFSVSDTEDLFEILYQEAEESVETFVEGQNGGKVEMSVLQ